MNRNTFSCRLAGVMLCFLATGPASAGCTLASAAHRVTVLELYTSEGCNTCPPADRWLSGLSTQASTMSKVIPLAFHVDYWNQLGWFDRFSQPRFSERQRQIAERNRMHVIYTPQFVLDGRDWRRDNRTDALDAALTSINAQPARATIQAEVSSGSGGLRVRVTYTCLRLPTASLRRPGSPCSRTGYPRRCRPEKTAGRPYTTTSWCGR
jgi:hypothetical protein